MKCLIFLISLFPFIVSAQEFSLMTYNLKNFLAQNTYKNGEVSGVRYKPDEEIEAIVKIIANTNPDLLGLCEIGTEKDLEKLRGLLRKKGLDYPHVEHVNAADSVRHLALLSKYPLASRSYTDLIYNIADKKFPLRRGLLHVEADISGQKIHLLGAHLKSKRPVEYADQNTMRLKEAHLIRDQITTILQKSPEAKLLLYGDLNDTFKSSTLSTLKGHYRSKLRLEPLDLKASDGTYWTHFWSYQRVYSTFDYVLCNHALLDYVDHDKSKTLNPPETLIASDHRPQVVYFNLSE